MRPLAGSIYYFQNKPEKKGNREKVFLKSRTQQRFSKAEQKLAFGVILRFPLLFAVPEPEFHTKIGLSEHPNVNFGKNKSCQSEFVDRDLIDPLGILRDYEKWIRITP